MKRYENYENVEAFTGDFEQLQLGGHVCKIRAVTVTPAPVNKNYDELMTIEFDIAEGEQKGFYQRRYEESFEKNGSSAKWQGKLYQTIKESDLRFFKGFITAIENSNPGYKFNFDEATLVGKLFGGVFGDEEYLANDGTIKIRTKCMRVRSVEEIRKGVDIPILKKLSGNNNVPSNVNFNKNDDLPF